MRIPLIVLGLVIDFISLLFFPINSDLPTISLIIGVLLIIYGLFSGPRY